MPRVRKDHPAYKFKFATNYSNGIKKGDICRICDSSECLSLNPRIVKVEVLFKPYHNRVKCVSLVTGETVVYAECFVERIFPRNKPIPENYVVL